MNRTDEKVSSLKTILGNSTILIAVKLSLPLANFILAIVIARILGVRDFGIFAIIFVYQNIFRMISVFGMDALLIREIARDENRADTYLGNTYLLGALLAFINMILMNAVIFLAGYSVEIKIAGLIASLALIPDVMIMYSEAAFIAMRKNFYMLFTVFGREAFKVIFVFAILVIYRNILATIAALSIVSFFGLFLNAVFVRKYLFMPKFVPNRAIMKEVFRTSPVLALISIMSNIFLGTGVIVLSKMNGAPAAGLYNASYKFIMLAFLFIDSIGITMLPLFSKLYLISRTAFRELAESAMKYLAILVTFFSILVFFLAKVLIMAVYGAAFADSLVILQVLIWATLFLGGSYLMARAMLAANMQKYDLIAMIAATVLNIPLTLALTSLWGYSGTALATVISAMVLFSLHLYFFNKKIHRFNIIGMWARPIAIGGIPFFLLALYMSRSNLCLGLCVSGAIYFLILAGSGVIKKEEMAIFVKALSPFSSKA